VTRQRPGSDKSHYFFAGLVIDEYLSWA